MRRRNSLITIIIAVAALLPAMTACKKKDAPAPPPVNQTKPAPPKPVQGQQSSNRTGEGAERRFDFSSKKDPFKAFLTAPKPQQKAPSAIPGAVSGLPIQSYELSQFKVIGLIGGLKENKGMVVDPTGKAYVIREGMTIGKNNGKIIKITAQYAEVAEQYLDDNGKLRKRVVRLTLPRKD